MHQRLPNLHACNNKLHKIKSYNLPAARRRFTLKGIGGGVQIVTVWLQIINQIIYSSGSKQSRPLFRKKLHFKYVQRPGYTDFEAQKQEK
jgi:hypothetical protein